jgi:ribosomal protein S18 acetylase RimI-like enzyme
MLRNAAPDDLTTVVSWIHSQQDCDLWTGGRINFPVDMAALPERISFGRGHAYVWIVEARVAAFGQILIKPTGRAHLATIIVSPSLRGHGHGRQFVAALLAHARSQGSPVSLNVDALNSRAVSLYEDLGFINATRPPDQAAVPGVRYMELA